MFFAILISLLSVLDASIVHFKNTSAEIVVPSLIRTGQKHTVDADFFIMKTIIITSPKYGIFPVLVDDSDFESLSKHNWYLQVTRHHDKFYAYTVIKREGKRRSVKMHRLIMGEDIPFPIDHKDGNGLNNQRDNLRVATISENGINRKTSYNKTGFRGVMYDKRYKSYYVFLHVNNKKRHLGTFVNPVDAAIRYNEEALKVYGKFAVLNTITEDSIQYYKNKLSHRKSKTDKNATGFKGVSRIKRNLAKPYYAYINAKKQHYHLGMFETAVEAAKAYNNAAIKLHGNHAVLNIIS